MARFAPSSAGEFGGLVIPGQEAKMPHALACKGKSKAERVVSCIDFKNNFMKKNLKKKRVLINVITLGCIPQDCYILLIRIFFPSPATMDEGHNICANEGDNDI